MQACLRVLRAGPGATIQDGGRHGYLRFGVTPAGPMDWTAFRTANLALGNDDRAAAVEIPAGGIEVMCQGAPLAVAFAGAAFEWRRNGQALPKPTRLRLQPGETLLARAGKDGTFAYLTVENGFDTPVVMGSRATHMRSAIGGIEGRMLMPSDVLPARGRSEAQTADSFEATIDAPWLLRDKQAIRVVLGPQDDYFAEESLDRFFSARFTITPTADRMAYRFDGPEIVHARGYDIVSDGIALGAIQIAGDKKPLVLMADRQPTGGYPKLGHVIRADIGRLAQMFPGETCQFSKVSIEEARAALFALEDEIAETPSRLRPLRRDLSSSELLGTNLIDGFVNANDQIPQNRD